MTRPEPQGGRGAVWPSAVAGLAVLMTSLSLGAMFDSGSWFPPALLTVLVVTLAGILFRSVPRLHRTGLAVLFQLVAGFCVLTAMFAPGRALLGFLPTPSSTAHLWGVLGTGVADMYQTQAPAPVTPGLLAIILLGVVLITLVVDGLASDIGAPKVAGIPLLLIYLVPMTVYPTGLHWWHFALAATGYLFLIGIRRRPRSNLDAATSSATPVTAGALAILLALLVPLALPGTVNSPLDAHTLSRGGSASNITVINPFLDLRRNLAANDDRPVLNYRTTQENPGPLRLVTADRFNGSVWEPSPVTVNRAAVADDGLPQPPGLGADISADKESMRVHIQNLDQDHLPAPYPTTRTSTGSSSWLYETDTLSILGDRTRTTGLNYSLDYLAVAPTSGELLAAGEQGGLFPQLTQLPDDVPKVVLNTAKDVVGDEQNHYRQAVALQNYFRSGQFTYTTKAPPDGGNGALASFLKTKAGYCVQFSSAMTVMARSLGIPARIAIGFLPGTKQADGSWQVTLSKAHAWPELYFPGIGWTRFEPTPGSQSGPAPAYTEDAPTDTGNQPGAADLGELPEQRQNTIPESTDTATTAAPTQAAPLTAADATPGWQRFLPAPIVVLAVIVLLLVPTAVVGLLRARRWGAAKTAPAFAEAAWADVMRTGGDLGLRWRSAETPRERAALVDAVIARGGDPADEAREALSRIVSAVEAARYAAPGRGGLAVETREGTTAEGLRADTGLVAAALRRVSRPWVRIRAFVLRPSIW